MHDAVAAYKENASTRVVTAYSYHLKPPYIIDEKVGSGLYFDLLALLSDNEIQYQLAYMPRKRINQLLERDALNGIIIGVSPHWFSDRNRTKYLWTAPFIEDKDEIISHRRSPFEFRIHALTGRTMAGVRGLFYVGLNDATTSGRLARFDTESEEQIIDMIHHQRVDFGVVSRSTLNYLHDKNSYVNSLFISTIPHETYYRHMLVPHKLQSVETHLSHKLESELKAQAWKNVLDRYSLSPTDLSEAQ
jgi:polar amino acid transport system substrate-binding protein